MTGKEEEPRRKRIGTSTGKQVPEKGIMKMIVVDLVSPFSGLNHVLCINTILPMGLEKSSIKSMSM